MSALEVKEIGGLRRKLRALANEMIEELRREQDTSRKVVPADHSRLLFSDALILAHWRAQSYNGELYVDLADFCDCLAKLAPADTRALCYDVASFIRDKLTIVSC